MQLPSDPPRPRGWLAAIERAGNRLPHPFWLFALLAAAVALGSAIAAAAGAGATPPNVGRVAVRSLLTPAGLDYMLSSMIANFMAFPPLGLVLVLMFGVGVAQRSGLLDALMRRLVLGAAPGTVTAVVALTGLMGNLASDSAAIVLPTLAAGAFAATGRHPLAGLALAWCCVLGGFSANLLIAGTDVILADITTRAARGVDPAAYVSPASNWYFMSASTLLLAAVAIWVTRRYVEPRLGCWDGAPGEAMQAPDPGERRGLRRAGIAALGLVLLAVLVVRLPGGAGKGYLLTRLAVLLPLFFGVVGYVYGRSTGRIRGPAQVPGLMADALRELAPFLVMAFAAAQAIAWFHWAHLDVWLAERGAGLLQQRALDGVGGLLLFALVAGLAALFIGSASALWTLLAPVFVPMFMLRGIDPAYVQAAFRVTDSATNTLMPLGPLVTVMLGFLQKYDPRSGVGTLLALTLPYTLAFLLAWLALLALWAGLGWPVGPGHGLYRG